MELNTSTVTFVNILQVTMMNTLKLKLVITRLSASTLRTTREDGLPAPITALDVVYGLETPPRRGFHKIPVNLNVSCGRGAPHIYICYSTTRCGLPVTNIQVVAGKRKEFPIQDGYIKILKDLNQGAGGKHIYLCYTTCTAFPPVTAVNVIHDDTVHVYPENG